MVTATAIVFAVNVLTSILKRWIYPRFGALGVQATAFILAFIAAIYVTWKSAVPGLEAYVINGLMVFSLAVTFYEVVLSHLPVFKVAKLKRKV